MTAGADARTWRRAAFALFAVAAGTNVPTPLLLVYRDTLDLGPESDLAYGLRYGIRLAGPFSVDRPGQHALKPVYRLLISVMAVRARHPISGLSRLSSTSSGGSP